MQSSIATIIQKKLIRCIAAMHWEHYKLVTVLCDSHLVIVIHVDSLRK